MSDRTHIEWSDATWNPVTGCTKVSAGCDNCYAETLAERFRGTHGHYYERGFDVQLRPEKLDQPLRWRRPRRIFVNSMSDLFHDQVPDEYIAGVFAIMALSERHTFQLLTKRHARMRSLLSSEAFHAAVFNACGGEFGGYFELPLRNVWLGVSVENQQWADIRIPALPDTPAAIRFISAEPLLGSVDVSGYLSESLARRNYRGHSATCDGSNGYCFVPWCQCDCHSRQFSTLDWVIAGGESGRTARPMHPDWARGLRDQCVSAKVPFLFKQRGEWTWNELDEFVVPTQPLTDRVAVMHGAGMTAMTKRNPFNPFERGHPFWATRIERVGKKRAGRKLDGRTWDQYPKGVTV